MDPRFFRKYSNIVEAAEKGVSLTENQQDEGLGSWAKDKWNKMTGKGQQPAPQQGQQPAPQQGQQTAPQQQAPSGPPNYPPPQPGEFSFDQDGETLVTDQLSQKQIQEIQAKIKELEATKPDSYELDNLKSKLKLHAEATKRRMNPWAGGAGLFR
jgi:hypothetical protein